MRYRFLRFPGGKPKAVTLSYDDGCRYDIKLSETIGKYGIKATFNLNSASLGQSETDWRLTKEEIQKHLIDKGHEIATHGALHKANGDIKAIEGIRDVLDCRLGLENTFDCIVRGMAYPDSGIGIFHNNMNIETIETYLASLEIVYARALGKDNDSFSLPQKWYQWYPTAHHDNPNIFEYIDKFVNLDLSKISLSRRVPKLFYIWGHSYEFDQNNNWDRLEAICEKLGRKEDTWYATNIEIYEYIEAYNSLVMSADSLRMYNPTLKTIWLEIDGTPYTINPGETLKID